MPDLSASIQEMLNGRIVRVGHLIELAFDTYVDPVYVWNGFRTITVDGNDYVGLRELVGVEGLGEEEGDNLQASDVRVTLSGVAAELLDAAISADRGSYVGKPLMARLQFFDPDDWQLLDDPVAFSVSIIDGIEIDWIVNEDGSQTRSVTVAAQNIFSGRSVPPAGNYSSRDQQFRSPGDRGFEFVGNVPGRVTQVPW